MSAAEPLHAFLRARQSVRRFTATKVGRDVLERILTTAAQAPSAHNRQPWRFAVVMESQSKSALGDIMAERFRRDLGADGLSADEIRSRVDRSRRRIATAPAVVLLCMDTTEMDTYPDAVRTECERTMAIQSTANAGVMTLLAAHAEGLGAVWNCAPLFAPDEVRAVLSLPGSWEPQALLLMGLPDEQPAPRPRKPLQELAVFL
jgi:coenzyme F420-0:L-glutamate ligase/coenzyme F420-1:gamma-L-glutamate ligase